MKHYVILNADGVASVTTTTSDTPPDVDVDELAIEIEEIDEEEAMQIEEEREAFVAAALDPNQDLPKRARHKKGRRRGEDKEG